MNLHTVIAPYPGLRPFTESEALYFKGREKHIRKIQEELKEDRFLMVTGASGDGKSSLIYAGLLPNVRAGFFRGELGRWSVAILRPGHHPMQNLCEALTAALKEENAQTVADKLKYGYSALIDYYKQSSLYVDETTPEHLALDEKEQKKALRKGTNLLIVVDQFEEFFTNNENFNKETAVPSIEAQLAMNLLLETAKISREQGIPVYIVCTMRSDYIGNAPSYRGLPELIGDNQFFVPRLNREEITQVIEEPAALHGNKISKRLVQRLINDLDVVNTDVLPSLQHALRRIWQMADEGKDTLDLLHYAMAGGMNYTDLPDEDKQLFTNWLSQQPEYKQQLFHEKKKDRGISNILNHHGNELFETAHLEGGITLSKTQSQEVLKSIFQCLTQIDDSKAVRHRVTFAEAIEILNNPSIPKQQIELLLRLYRKQGNNFIYPFIFDETEDIALHDDTLLDITHEALIRNWDKLLHWTKQEYQQAKDLRDLNVLAERWIKEGETNNNLLSSGQYEYFIKHYPNKMPSAAWMKRYLEDRLYITDGRATKQIDDKEELSNEQLQALSVKRRKQLKTYLQISKAEIEKRQRTRKLIISTITLLLIISVGGFFWANSEANRANNLANTIIKTSKANDLATKAYTLLEHDPTLAFRLAEQSYNIEPTPLNQQVIMASYAKVPFYQKLVGHRDGVNYSEYAPNGKYVVTSSHDGDARLWDNKGNLLKILKGHTAALPYGTKSVLFSSDSKLIATCSTDSTARLWNLQGECLAIMKHDGKVNSVCFSPDNQKILTASSSSINIWDKNGKSLFFLKQSTGRSGAKFTLDNMIYTSYKDKILLLDLELNIVKFFICSGHINEVYGSNNGRIIACQRDNIATVWNYITNNKIELKGHTNFVKEGHFTYNDSLIATSSMDHTIRLWDLQGQEIAVLNGHTAFIWNVAFSPDSNKIATASDDGTAKIWNLDGNELMTLKGHSSQVFSVSWSPDGKKVVTASGDKTARIWEIGPKENPLFVGHTGWVMDANFSPDGQKIATAGWDYTARLWGNSGKQISSFKAHEGYGVSIANFRENNMFSIGSDGFVRFWDKFGTELFKTESGGGFNYSISFNLDSTLISIYAYDINQSQVINNKGLIIQKFENASIQFYGNKLLTFSEDSSMYMWKQTKIVDSLKFEKYLQLKTPNTSFTSVQFSTDNKWMITLSEDSVIRIWDATVILNGVKRNEETILYAGLPIKEIKVNAILNSIVFSPSTAFSPSPSGRAGEGLFIVISDDHIIRLWNINGELVSEYLGHSDAITDVNFSHDGRFIVSGSSDKSVRLWNLEGKEIMNYPGHTALVSKAKFSSDDKFILTASYDHTARLMPVTVQQVLDKINTEKVRGEVYELSIQDKKVYGIVNGE